MASSGTLLSDLDSKQPLENDGDLVQKIMADMNISQGSGGNPMMPAAALPPAPSARAMHAQNSPNPNTVMHHAMDTGPAMAHVIGAQHPSPADFASLMPNQGIFGPPGSMAAPYIQQPAAPPMPQYVEEEGWFKSSKASLLREIKTPLLVAIIVFVVSLPVINTMIGIYFPRLLRIGGDLTTLGLGLKSLCAGIFFWVLQRVLVPLVAA
jgi:hypothetical protein